MKIYAFNRTPLHHSARSKRSARYLGIFETNSGSRHSIRTEVRLGKARERKMDVRWGLFGEDTPTLSAVMALLTGRRPKSKAPMLQLNTSPSCFNPRQLRRTEEIPARDALGGA